MLPDDGQFCESDLFGTEQSPQIEIGTVGWDDTEEYFSKGDATNDGVTLVYVQLYRGRDPSVKVKPGIAAGLKIRAQVSGPLWVIPPKGTRVMVAIPEGHYQTPGAGVIIAWLGKSPAIQFSPTRAVLDVGSGMDLVIKGKSVTLSDYSAPGRFLTIGPPPAGGPAGIMALNSDGSGFTIQNGAVGLFASSGGDAKTVVQLTPSGATVMHKDSGIVSVADGKINIVSKGVAYLIGTKVGIGPAPAAPAVWGVAGISGIGSTSVWISP